MPLTTWLIRAAAAGFLVIWAATAQAQPGRPLDITADSLEYLADQKLMVGRGNVEVRDGGVVLKSDYMAVNTETREVHAVGNVFYQSGADTWTGQEFRYNLRTKQGDFGAFKAYYDPFYVTALASRRISENEYELEGVVLTTCDGERPEVSIEADRANIRNNRVRMNNAVVYIADTVPIFYMPYYTRSLNSHERFFQFLPGYNSRLGAFLLTAYNYPIAGPVRGITHLDYRTKRGLGFGQDFAWKDQEKTYEGIVQGYYLNDDDPTIGPARENREALVEEERYRIRLAHRHQLSERDSFLGEANYLSDPYILKDFFRKEYREAVQPENRATLTHRGDNFIAAAQVNKRLNDFYSNVDRMPELTLDVPRIPIGETDLYYESRNSASYLERVFPEGSTSEDYDAFRFDTGHQLYYPLRLGGFLNLIPRVGYQGTYYSETFSRTVVTNANVITPTNGASFVTNEVRTIVQEKGGNVRHIPKLGMEGSFKAFRAWDDLIVLGDGDGLRHVAEPYFDHTYWGEPNLLPNELPQFDGIDTLNKRHDIRLGFRNKLQTRRNDNPVDVIDLNLYTFYRVEKNANEEDFSDLFLDGNLRLHRSMLIEFDSAFDPYESELRTFNTRVMFNLEDASYIGLEHRYRKDSQNLLGLTLDLFPRDRWSFQFAARYNAEESELEEHFYMVKRRGQCVSWGLGVREIRDQEDDELEVFLLVWLTAFPDALIQANY
ncbi:MAG TPA: LPS assembly protein LptD [Kiritimatiellia bacterium]|nr:LPS assembly protein LptD [Kiritimatiellia bacterium]HMO98763.1 LPS assembly protein LptD [Kiritimatiellia bacterium]HMP95939.1 LPS assembly protein LptD [Kiritimatiellia bacterium]